MLDFTREELLDAIERFVAELLEKGHSSEPPIDMIALAEGREELRACVEKKAKRKHQPEQPPSKEQRQHEVALEIGRVSKGEILKRLGVASQGRGLMPESVAGLIADRLQMPTKMITMLGKEEGWDLLSLRTRFATVTLERLAWRLLDLDQPCIITVLENDAVLRRRSNYRRVTKTLTAEEQACVELVSQENKPQSLQRRGWTVQGWPSEEDSKSRTILRSVGDAEDESSQWQDEDPPSREW
jgi:hypothetical protein